MSAKVRPRRGRKLLVASAGVASISFIGVGCSGTSVANLPAPPSCEVAPSAPYCHDAGTDAADASHDAGADAAADANHDAGADAADDANHDVGADAAADASPDVAADAADDANGG